MPARNGSSDFNAEDLTKKSDQHDKLLSKLQSRVGTNENFGKTFAEASDSSKELEGAMQKLFLNMLSHDHEARTAVKGLVKETDNHLLKVYLTSGVRLVGWIVSLVIAAVVGAYINAHVH